jgi:hypothetical protein
VKISTLLHTAATCDEQDAWTDENVAFGWLVPTPEDAQNVRCYRELNASYDATVGYVFH